MMPVPYRKDDIVDSQGESFECLEAGKIMLGTTPSGELIIAPGGPFEFAPVGKRIEFEELDKIINALIWASAQLHGPPSHLDGPTGPVGSPGAPGQPGQPGRYSPPALLHTSSTKPLLYSVDVYRSLKDSQYVAISSFPVVSINDGLKIKPYAVGITVQDATGKLADSIRGLTGRKEVSVINEHQHTNQWVCVHCHDVRGYPTKTDLVDHITLRHSGNLGLEKYTNPAIQGVWLKMP